MRDGNEGAASDSVTEQSFNLLEYLSAVAREVGPAPVRDVRQHDPHILPSAVPAHASVKIGPAEGRQAWLSVARIPAPAPAQVPEWLAPLLAPVPDGKDPLTRPQLAPVAVQRQIEVKVLDQLGPTSADDTDEDREVRAKLRRQFAADAERGFTEWLDSTWVPWEERSRPVYEARRLYAALYDLHLKAEAESATYEVVWGHVVVSARDGASSVVAPMLTARAIVEVDQDDATIRVMPEQGVELELDALEGTSLNGMDGLVSLQATLRETPPDIWDPEQLLSVRRQISAQLGIDAVLVDDKDPATPTANPQVNDGWVLFMHKRPMRQERFYDELAHKILYEGFLPEGLASVVADRDRVDDALRQLGREVSTDDGTADRLLMPLPANAEQVRIASQLARSRGVTVQGPPGTGKSHTIVNLVSHLVAQGKRVLVTAEKEQALSVLRDKIPEELRDLSLAVLESTPTAMEELRSAAQSMQDSLSSLDVPREEKRIAELGTTVDALRESIARTDAALVRALQSEQREYPLPTGPARAPQVAEWLAERRELDVIKDRVPVDAKMPITPEELAELAQILRETSAEDAAASALTLPEASKLPAAATLQTQLKKLDELRSQVTSLEDRGLRVETLDGMTLESIRQQARMFRDSAARMRALSGQWEDRYAQAIRHRDHAVTWVVQHNPATRERIRVALALASRLAGHVVDAPEGDPVAHAKMLEDWGKRVAAGKKLSMFAAKDLKEFSSQVQVDGYPVTTPAQLDLVRTLVELRTKTRAAHVQMSQAYAPCQIPVPPLDNAFLFAADQLAARVDDVTSWWSSAFPSTYAASQAFVTAHDAALRPESLEEIASLLDGAAARIEERELEAHLASLRAGLVDARQAANASPLWGQLVSALDLSRPDQWDATMTESHRLFGVRARVLRGDELRERLSAGGAPIWARAILDSRGAADVVGGVENAAVAWERAKARSWLSALHSETDLQTLMESSHTDATALRRAIIDLANRSARVELKHNLKDRQRRALETWLTAVKRVGKGTGKNAPRFQAAAREALPAAMGAVPIWIMPIYRVMENFDPRVSDLFDVVVVDESSQCNLLSLGVLALGKKIVVVGDDKQTTPERVGIQTHRIAALQDQYLKGMPEAKLLTLDDSLYSISGRAFPSTIALKEHFRCVPEIIEFSNRYYNGSILPLREVSVPQIGDPVKAVHVDDAVSIVRGSSRVNLDEAEAITAQVVKCIEDPAYEGLTFGVVTMMSGPQAQILQDLIRDAIGDEEFEHRRLRVGNPPMFQGDERNVMFVSMVAHDASFAATTTRYAQWANVAASRAQDQLWIFYSMDPATLHHEDQRRAMIEYAQGHGHRKDSQGLFELTESKFERDVLKQMLARGYDVTPQHRVGRYRIDFVVNVANGEKLAVECDGDTFHGPDKWDEDVRRQRVLERLGWSFWRIRASKYYLDPEQAMRPLWARLEEMKARAAEAAQVAEFTQERAEQARLEKLQAQPWESLEPEPEASPEPEPEPETDPVTESTPELPAEAPKVATVGFNNVANTAPSPTEVEQLLATAKSVKPERTSGSPQRTTPVRVSPMKNPTEVRRWARENGYAVGDRGRIPAEVYEAFSRAMSGSLDKERNLANGPQPGSIDAPVAGSGTSTIPTSTRIAGGDDTPESKQFAAKAAWETGTSYQLDSLGNITPRNSTRTLATVIGSSAAAQVRNQMQAVRPNGGRFKVGKSGVMATLIDGKPAYVCTVRPDYWFPDHWTQ